MKLSYFCARITVCSSIARWQQERDDVKNYEYRSQLTYDEHANPLIRAAFAVADRAHKHQPRHKLDPDIPYITHPFMGVDILYRMGVIDPLMIAAALLHDTLEDYKPYKTEKNFHRMLKDLKTELQTAVDAGELTQAQADADAQAVFDLVKQVTKPDHYGGEGKIEAQVDAIKKKSLRGKMLKIADQGATLACRLVAPDGKKFTKQDQIEWREKADNLVSEILHSVTTPEEIAALAPWEIMYSRLSRKAEELEQANGEKLRETIRAFTDFDWFFSPAKQHAEQSIKRPVKETIGNCVPRNGDGSLSSSHLLRVDYNGSGEVTSFVMQRGIHPGDDIYTLRIQFFEQFAKTDFLATGRSSSPTKVEAAELEWVSSGVEGRLFHLTPPMKIKQFLGTATSVQLITVSTSHRIEKEIGTAVATTAMLGR
jgi:hypothetical protein